MNTAMTPVTDTGDDIGGILIKAPESVYISWVMCKHVKKVLETIERTLAKEANNLFSFGFFFFLNYPAAFGGVNYKAKGQEICRCLLPGNIMIYCVTTV